MIYVLCSYDTVTFAYTLRTHFPHPTHLLELRPRFLFAAPLSFCAHLLTPGRD